MADFGFLSNEKQILKKKKRISFYIISGWRVEEWNRGLSRERRRNGKGNAQHGRKNERVWSQSGKLAKGSQFERCDAGRSKTGTGKTLRRRGWLSWGMATMVDLLINLLIVY